jgi:hypothetical protein
MWDETIKHLFFQCNFAHSIWLVIQAALGLYPPTSVAKLGIGYMVLITSTKFFWGWERLHLSGRCGYVEMIKCFMYGFGRLFIARRSSTSSRRCAHVWKIRRGIFFRDTDGSMIFRPALHELRHFTNSHYDMYFAFLFLDYRILVCVGCIHLVMQRSGVILIKTI